MGTDVESLFPSLDDQETANPCYKAILDTEVELDNFNYKKGLECVAMRYTKEEVLVNPLRRFLPTRTFNKCARLGSHERWTRPGGHWLQEETDHRRSGTGGGGRSKEEQR